jgi:uroporphyrinogen decarboxylase
MMNRHQRVQAALEGKDVDRVPVSAWGHFYHKEHTAEGLAEAMLSFQEQYDWDFMKINPRASYHAEGWGYTYSQSGKPEDKPRCTAYPLHEVKDWRKLEPLPSDQGVLGEHLRAVELIRKGLKGRVPFIMTVFSPLMVAGYLANLDTQAIKRHVQEDPVAVSYGLAAIAETFADFVRKLAAAGLDGVYFATTWANDGMLRAQEYRELARPHDMLVLEEARNLWFNMLHLCRDRIHLEAMANYPVHAIHWDMHTGGNPNMAEGKTIAPVAVAGGVDRRVLAEGSDEEVKTQVRRALIQTGTRRFLLGPSCSVEIAITPEANFRTMRSEAEKSRG